MLNQVIAIAKNAGLAIKAHYLASNTAEVHRKADRSPVTQTDLLSHHLICHGLSELTPELPIISEESTFIPDWNERKNYQRYWLIDPLDGTQEFIHRTGDFAVNIALIEGNEPILGVVYLPMVDTVYYAQKNLGAFKKVGLQAPTAIHCRPFDPKTTLCVVASRRHGNQLLSAALELLPPHTLIQRGSTLKICVVAEGSADLYPRLGPTSEWDTAAAQLIIEAAGGHITDLNGKRLTYNQKDTLKNPFFIATNANWQALSPYLSFFQGSQKT